MTPFETYWLTLCLIVAGCLGIGYLVGRRHGFNAAVDQLVETDDLVDDAFLEDIYAD